MSHFTVLVVGPNIEEQLQPFHEFECTGENDQYVIDVDQTEEARENFDGHKETRYKTPDGVIVSCYNEEGQYTPEFLRSPTPEELAAHRKDPLGINNDGLRWSLVLNEDGEYENFIFCVPEGYTAVEVLTSDHETFAEWIEGYYGHKIVPFGEQPQIEGDKAPHKFGYTIVDENGEVVKTVNRTNPNKQWDWYQVGGRWNGFFKLKAQAAAAGAGVVGTPGLNRMDPDYEPPTQDRADSCLKGDIDIEGMRDQAGERAAKRYDDFHAVIADCPPMLSWRQIKKQYGIGATVADEDAADDSADPVLSGGIEAARKAMREQPANKALIEDERTNGIWEVDEYLETTREKYIQAARDGAISTFAVLKDGQWHERGSMGWWGCVSDEKDEGEWTSQFSALIDSLPDDTLLTVVDCHI